jgi:hypothetical protein
MHFFLPFALRISAGSGLEKSDGAGFMPDSKAKLWADRSVRKAVGYSGLLRYFE